MALPSTFDARQIQVKFGDGASPEVFATDCLINASRAVSLSAQMTEEEVFDCTSLTLPATLYRIARSVGLSITGTGKAHKTTMKAMADLLLSGASKNVQVEIGGTGGLKLAFAARISEFTPAEGDPSALATASLTIVSTGTITTSVIA